MAHQLATLSASEKELVYKAPLLVCILIAGADGKIDDREIGEAMAIARDRQWVDRALTSFYLEVSEDFEDKIKMLIQSYPFRREERNKSISAELSGLNFLWSKLDAQFSVPFYESLKFLANRIASSSGGFFQKVSQEEKELLDLPMIAYPTKN